jgi:hypothetical protein
VSGRCEEIRIPYGVVAEVLATSLVTLVLVGTVVASDRKLVGGGKDRRGSERRMKNGETLVVFK